MLDDLRIERYARHILLREVGGVGQERILRARVRIDGMGEAGCWAATYLALAGVGRLALADPREVPAGGVLPLFAASDAGKGRVAAAAEAIAALNPDVVVEAAAAAIDVLKPDVVVEASPGGRDSALAGVEIAELRLDGLPDPYVVAAGGGHALGGWGFSCLACMKEALLRDDSTSSPGGTAFALAGSVAASEILAALLQPGQARPRGQRLHHLGEPIELPPCPHGGAA